MRPIIGIVGTPFDKTKAVRLGFAGRTTGTRTTYEDAILRAGGAPIILSPSSEQVVIDLQLALVDGLLLQGGGGDEKTEEVHLQYIKKALDQNLPMLGICMGMQLINVALGGKIGLIDSGTSHAQTTPLYRPSHNITIEPDSVLFDIFGSSASVNSHHRFHITQLAHSAVATARSDDLIIEAIEIKNKKFALGVQWHPEHLLKKDDKWLELFKQFIAHCK